MVEKYDMSYGSVILGRGQVMFIVPHGYNGDEKGVHELVSEVCVKTSTSAILNTKIPRKQINLNNFSSIQKAESKVAWAFFDDATRLVNEISDCDSQSFVFSVHLCPRVFIKNRLLYLWGDKQNSFIMMFAGDVRPYQIDLGAGVIEVFSARARDELTVGNLEKLFWPVSQVRTDMKNTGWVICDRRELLNIKRELQAADIKVTVGLEWPAGCRDNLLQRLYEIVPVSNYVQLECVAETSEDMIRLKNSLIRLTEKLTS